MAATFLTARELQEILHVDRTTIYRMADAGRLPAVKVGAQWRFPRRQMEQWLNMQFPAEDGNPSGAPAQFASLAHATAPAAILDPVHSPGGEPSTLAVESPLDCVQIVLDTFADALGVMILMTDLRGRPLTRTSNPCGLVQAIESQPQAHARCLQWWVELARRPDMQPVFLPSHLGLLCTRGFVRQGESLRGMVIFGGIAPAQWPPSAQEIDHIAEFLGVDPLLVLQNQQAVYHMDGVREQRLLTFVQRVADIVTHILGACASSAAPAQHL